MYGIAYRYDKDADGYEVAVDMTHKCTQILRDNGDAEAVGTLAKLGETETEQVWIAVVGTSEELKQLPLFNPETVPTIN